MLQQDLYQHQHQRQSTPGSLNSISIPGEHSRFSAIDINVRRSSTFASDTISPSAAEVVRDVPLVSPRIDIHSAAARTPSPGPTGSRRHDAYDNRPIKPLDQKLLETKLNEYPVDNVSASPPNSARARNTTKRVPVQLAYNANRYSPKTTARGPTASNALHSRATKTVSRREFSFARCQRSTNSITESNIRTRRVSRPSSNLNASRSSDHSFETRPSQMRRVAAKVTPERQTSVIESIENQKTRKDSSYCCFSAMNSSSISRRNDAR